MKDNTFNVKKDEVFGLLGPNGAGKTTTFNILTMDLNRTDGEVKVNHRDLDKLNIVKQNLKLGVCP